MSAVYAGAVTVRDSGSLTVNPGGGGPNGWTPDTVLRLHIRNMGPLIAFVGATPDPLPSNGSSSSSPRSAQGYPLEPGDSIVVTAPAVNLDVAGELPTRVAILAEV